MAKLPTFLTKATDANGEFVCNIDMGVVLLNMDYRRAVKTLEKLANGQTDYGHLPIYVGMPKDYLNRVLNTTTQKLINEVYNTEDAISFVEAIGGLTGFRQFSELHRHSERLENKRTRIFNEMVSLFPADFVLAPEAEGELLYDNLSEKFGDVETLLLQYDMPPSIREISDDAERYAAMGKWVRENCRPFAWDTYRLDWPGLKADDIISQWDDIYYEDDDDADPMDPKLLKDLIVAVKEYAATDVDDVHHEDAASEIVDIDALDGIITTWFNAKGDQQLDKLAFAKVCLDELLQGWNERQTITSHFRDTLRVVGLHPDVTRKECEQFLQKEMSDLTQEIEKTKNAWLPPISEGVREVAEPFEKLGIWIDKCPYTDTYKVRSTPADIEGNFPTLELAVQFAQELVR